MSRRKEKDGKLALLRSVPLFANLDDHELEEIARHADQVSVPEGKVLVTQEAAGNSFYVIIEGSADVIRDGQKLAELTAGDLEFYDGSKEAGPRNVGSTNAAFLVTLVRKKGD